MKHKFTNEITKDFDTYNSMHHYIFYGEDDILNKELPIKTSGIIVGSVVLNNKNEIFSINVTNVRYSDAFEKYVSDKYMDKCYCFDKDEVVKTNENL